MAEGDHEHDPQSAIDGAIERATQALLDDQQPDGHWIFELESDCTIPAEYILMMHFLDEVDEALQARLAAYLRRRQNDAGGWPLYHGGDVDVSCSVKAYYALKLAGDDPEAAYMRTARRAILNRGGAARANVFTRILLYQYRQVPWRAVPMVPVELMLLPRWFPFHIHKVAYWSRTVMIPLAVLVSLRVRARNPLGVAVPPDRERSYFPVRNRRNRCYLALERAARPFEPLVPGWLRRRAVQRAHDWVLERLNGEDGLGAIFPAMVNAYEMLDALGYPRQHPARRDAGRALRRLVVEKADEAYCQPCVSPVWDTALAAHALVEVGGDGEAVQRALDWLAARQVAAPGDFTAKRPGLAGGGWPFQYRNDHYPDLDDTSMVAWAMLRHDAARYADAVRRAVRWLTGMQSANGGFGAFDADNTHDHLNDIPFADHGALLDPPTEDVSARVAVLLGCVEPGVDSYPPEVRQRVERYLTGTQTDAGCWWGRWGTNYIYGTWSVVVALEALGVAASDPRMRRAAEWLLSVQRPDGGWSEDNDSYLEATVDSRYCLGNQPSTAFQTAWALLALMAAGETHSSAVRRGIDYLVQTQGGDGRWRDSAFTAPGFPRVLYLKYHGYSQYFPLWAMARYRNLAGASS
jgi:squalene-hopene/tetraprenyl-beta-curcumene cyclase